VRKRKESRNERKSSPLAISAVFGASGHETDNPHVTTHCLSTLLRTSGPGNSPSRKRAYIGRALDATVKILRNLSIGGTGGIGGQGS